MLTGQTLTGSSPSQITKTMGKVLQTMDLGKIQLTMDKFEQVQAITFWEAGLALTS